MPDTSASYFSSILCTSAVTCGISVAFLIVGLQHRDACCDEPLANWNIACGAIGISLSVIVFAAFFASKYKAKKLAKDIGPVPSRAPDGTELSDAQKAAVAKVLREHEESKARVAAMYHGPLGKVFGLTQSCHSCYVMIMVIIGAVFVWSTSPSDTCGAQPEPMGCEPFLWYWTQAWVITNFVIWGLTCCCLCCGIFAVATMRGADMEGMANKTEV